MYLTLEVVSPQAASLGTERRRVVGTSGMTIGRMPGNDWVFPDPYVSKQHARISYADGAFFVEGLGRNAIALGHAGNALPGHQPQPLKNGDRLFIDQYEIVVTAMQGDPPVGMIPDGVLGGSPAQPDLLDPFAVLADSAAPARGVVTQPGQGGPGAWPDSLGAMVETDVLDPLKAIGGGPPPPKPEGLPGVDWNRSSVLEDHFAPPPVPSPRGGVRPIDLLETPQAGGRSPAPAPRAPVSSIPSNWDKTNFTRMQADAAAARPQPRPTPAPARNDGRTAPLMRPSPGSGRAPARAAPPPKPRAGPGAPAVRAVPPPASASSAQPPPPTPVPGAVSASAVAGAGAGGLDSVPSTAPATDAVAAATISQASASAQAPSTALAGGHGARSVSAGNAGQQTDFVQFMRGAGLSDQHLAPETMRELGEVFRIVVQGVMDVLRARADIKSQFRMPMTRIQATENNPLKHAPNIEGALNILLVQRNAGYLGTQQAFEDAFADIRAHQMAMLEGVKLAYDAMLKRFDPKELEAMFERSGKRTRGFGGGKSKFWDLYSQHFAELGSDPDDMFRKLFGNDFAEAYERQLERLKSLESKNGKN
jgi:type VI secretion system protein ImpI